MFTQDEIDAVLSSAESAVDSLADNVRELSSPGEGARAAVATRAEQPAAKSAPAPGPSRQASVSRDGRNNRTILKLGVTVSVRLAGQEMMLSEVLKFIPGTIIEFERTSDEELDLVVGGKVIGKGVAVKLNEHFGIRINRIGGLRERIESLGP